ncbi:MAG TPA: 3-deoxy-7-phosphoheptulonate synthase [Gemmatimonadales bacterium]|jgi:3-deoxy-7-phosphoheptulonate synthase|nr:3-deoxy-7-phosphoheptulonate synthase [Gemmatimonadales bacterium]
MLVVLRSDAASDDRNRVVALIESLGFRAQIIEGHQRSFVAIVDHDGRVDGARFTALPGVEEIIHVTRPYKLVAREWRAEPTVVRLPGGLSVGGTGVLIIAGPCAVESEAQILATARAVKAAGATALRGGAFKPRTSPYAFQGLGERGLELLAAARADTGLLVVTEAMDEEGLDRVAAVADVIQIGARNMQNYSLLKRAGRAGKPVLLKRGVSAGVTDLLLSAEYVVSEGNPDVMLCERGIRGLDAARNLFDLNLIPTVKSLSHLPIIADPSHGTGRRSMVPAMARAAVAAGADGLLIEVHENPDQALSDGAQSLYPEQFALLMEELRGIAAAIGRRLL